MKTFRQTALILSIFTVIALTGCATEPKKLEPVNTPPSKGGLLKGLDVVQQPELEPEWADFVKAYYPRWRQHYWVDRGDWGNRGYIIGAPAPVTAPAEVQITPLPITTNTNTPAITVAPIAPPTIVESETPAVEDTKPKTYTVKKGDSLWRIAGRVYGNPFKWPRIYKANQDKIKSPNKIRPGQVFVIPQD